MQVTRHLSATRRPARLASGRDSVQSSVNGISHREPRSGHPIDGLGQPSSEHGQGPRSTQGSPVASECIMPSWCTMERSADATAHCEPSSSNCAKPQFIKHAREKSSVRSVAFATPCVAAARSKEEIRTSPHFPIRVGRLAPTSFAHTCGVVPRIRGLGFDLATGRG